MEVKFEQKPNTSKLAYLREKLEEFVKTGDGKDWITQRYGDYLYPNEIINQLKLSIYSILVSQGNNVIGFGDISFSKRAQVNQLGYFIFPEYTKQGVGYLLAEMLLKYALQNRIKIKAECEITNIPSSSLLNKLAETYKPSQIEINKDYSPNTQIFIWGTVEK